VSGRVEGKVVVVTGAAGGQGAVEAAWLVREGADVVATDLPAEGPQAPTGAGSYAYRRVDVTSEEDWKGLAAWLEAEHGRVDALVNNAGITFRGRLGAVARADWDRVLATNLTGAFLGMQALLPLMPRGASIVNIGSVAALTGHYPVAYTVSKWGLRGLSHVASLELGRLGIRVNTIHPGYIETPMTASAPPAFLGAQLAETPLGRAGRPEDVAPLVVFLVSDESAYLSGAEIPVDGGQASHGGTKSLSDALRAASPGEREKGSDAATNGRGGSSEVSRSEAGNHIQQGGDLHEA
jgi:3alpha(or 20beta)-hydroxysteroid dehydrogenase